MDMSKAKKLLFVPLIAGALGIPYAVVDGGLGELMSSFGKSTSSQPAHGALVPFDPNDPTASATLPALPPLPGMPVSTARLEGPQVRELGEVIRFDISPRWVAENWSRVSTVSAELELEALRVPLVTGYQANDLAGSLTYYFDKHHTVQRLTFHGTTGDERRLVALLTSTFSFREQPALGGGMYAVSWNGKPMSVLRVAYSPVVSATALNSQREITLEINRPGDYYGLSREMTYLLDRDKHVRRW
jgi:hypothetical protein